MLGSCQQDCAPAWELRGRQLSPPEPQDWDPAVPKLLQVQCGIQGCFFGVGGLL